MDYKYIEQLLDRYFECETTLEEEAILRSFFRQKDVPVRLLPYRDLFTCEDHLREARLGEDFDKRILALVEPKEESVKARRLTLSYRLGPVFKAAASLAILLTFTMAIQQASHQAEQQMQPISVEAPVSGAGPETALGTAPLAPDSNRVATPDDAATTLNGGNN